MAKRKTKATAVQSEESPPATLPDPRGNHPSLHETIVLVVATLVLVALAYAVQPVLSPFVLVGSLVYLLYPLRQKLLVQRVLWLGVFLFLCWLFYSVLHLLAPFILAFLMAYILHPLVSKLERHGIRRWVSSLIAVLLLVGVVVSMVLFVMPLVIQQFQGIIAGMNAIANDFAALLKSGKIFNVLSRYGVPVEKAREFIGEQISPRLEDLLKNLFEAVFGFVTSISTLALQLINAVMIPFLLFYMLMDFPRITDRFVQLFPERRRERLIEIGGKVDTLLGKYFRGAIIVAILQGSISAVALWLIGVKYALVLGIMTGILNFIPYVGLITSLVVSSIVALFSGEPILAKVIAVVILYLSQKLLEATVLAPKIIGAQVGLHPVLLILCLLIFGFFLGFVGLLIAVPATALLIAGIREWEANRLQRGMSQADGGV